MREWLSQLRQRPSLAIATCSLGMITIFTGVFAFYWLGNRSDDRVAVIGNFLSLGTLLLALAAGIIALLAYSAATGLPELRAMITTPLGGHREMLVFGDRTAEGAIFAATSELNIVNIVVKNTSKYSARTPAVIVEFWSGITADRYSATPGWTPIEIFDIPGGTKMVRAVQWDGGPNYSIHGQSTRFLPELNLQGLYPSSLWNSRSSDPPFCEIRLRLLADGYTRTTIKPLIVTFTFDPHSFVIPYKEPEWH